RPPPTARGRARRGAGGLGRRDREVLPEPAQLLTRGDDARRRIGDLRARSFARRRKTAPARLTRPGGGRPMWRAGAPQYPPPWLYLQPASTRAIASRSAAVTHSP